MNDRKWGRVPALGCALLLGAPLTVVAQDNGSPPSAEEPADSASATAPPSALEEIVVTAQRREQSLQDVPVAVTALSADAIESRGIDDVADLNALAPGLHISLTAPNSTVSQVTIRGSSQINPAIYWDPAVGIYVDGVYIGKAQGSVFNVVDLARVEVLRGPQGTLYGRNTIGGTINLVSRAPSGEFSGSASLELGSYNTLVQRASVDLPKMGIVSMSIAARSDQRDGWIDTDRNSPVAEFNNRNSNAWRLAADFDFSPTLFGEYRYDHSRVNQTANFPQLYRADQAFFDFVGYTGFTDYVDTERQDFASVNAPSFERANIDGHAFTLTLDLNRLTIKSISAYRRMDWNDSLDLDGSPYDIAFTQRFTDYEQFSQDLQFLTGGDAWNLVAGLYYFGDEGDTNNPQRFFSGGALYDSRYGTETAAWSAYGQADYSIGDWTLTAGLRYTHEKKKLDRVFGCNAPASGCDPGGADYYYTMPEGSTRPEKTFSATTPMASIGYQLADNANLYLRYAEGFKSGGFNGESGDPVETVTPFKPEKQQSLEVGAKSAFFGRRVQLNVAVFQNKLEDLQESVFTGSGAAASVIRNAGEATVRGVELETALLLGGATTLNLNYAYLDSEYDRFIDEGTDQADNRAFVHGPEHTFNVTLDSELAHFGWATLRATADYAWSDEFYTYPYQLQTTDPSKQTADNSKVDAYGLLNLRLALIDMPLGTRGTGELALWCRNALDDDTATNFIDFGPSFGNLTIANFEQPRMLGITGTIRW